MLREDVPVLLLGFNRPEKVPLILEPLRVVRPKQVFVSVDGPRPDRAGEAERCRETQAAFDLGIDWPCEVKRLYRGANLGCHRAVQGAITWALGQVEHCVVVEDDCVLEPDFFSLCAELLPRYHDTPEVMAIVATNFQSGQKRGDGDYYASKYAHCWGWATWARAWQHYQGDISALAPAVSEPLEKSLHTSEDERAYWRLVYERCRSGEVDSWAYRWLFSCWLRQGISLIPNVNLVTNTGFDAEGTHTTDGSSSLSAPQPLASQQAPASLKVVQEADEYTFRQVFCPPLSHAERQVYQFRIKALKAEAKRWKDEVTTLQKEQKSKSGGIKRLFGGA